MRENIQKINDKLLSNIMIAFLENDRLAIDLMHTLLLQRFEQNLVSLEEIEQVYSWFIKQ